MVIDATALAHSSPRQNPWTAWGRGSHIVAEERDARLGDRTRSNQGAWEGYDIVKADVPESAPGLMFMERLNNNGPTVYTPTEALEDAVITVIENVKE
jgi:hypothetical protein